MFRNFSAVVGIAVALTAMPLGQTSFAETVLPPGSAGSHSFCNSSDAGCQPLPEPPLATENPNEERVRSPLNLESPQLRNNTQRHPLDDQNYLSRNRQLPGSGAGYSGELYKWPDHKSVMHTCDVDEARWGSGRLHHLPREHRHIFKNHRFRDFRDFDYFYGTPDFYYDSAPPNYPAHGTNCQNARKILKHRGYHNIMVLKCGGTVHEFTALRRGMKYLLKLRAFNGRITVVRRYD